MQLTTIIFYMVTVVAAGPFSLSFLRNGLTESTIGDIHMKPHIVKSVGGWTEMGCYRYLLHFAAVLNDHLD